MRNLQGKDATTLEAQLGELGSRLSLARRRRCIRQRDLAQQVGVTVVTLRKLERGHGGVSLATALKALVAVGLGAELERLCRGPGRLQDREQARSHKGKAGAAAPQPAMKKYAADKATTTAAAMNSQV